MTFNHLCIISYLAMHNTGNFETSKDKNSYYYKIKPKNEKAITITFYAIPMSGSTNA